MTHDHPEAVAYAAAAPELLNAAEHAPGPWINIDKELDDYVESYEVRADEGDYFPTQFERFLIRDAIAGLFSDRFQDLIVDARRQQRESREKEDCCPACGCKKPQHWGACHEDPSRVRT